MASAILIPTRPALAFRCAHCVAEGVQTNPETPTSSGICGPHADAVRLERLRQLAPGDEGAGLSRLASGGSVSTPLAARSEVRA
jgi:hypothetical protein